jgi:hypothetical protein
LLTLGYPLALLLRLSPASWELGNRAGAFLYFGVSIVAAVAVSTQWLGRRPGPVRVGIVGILLTLVFLGGIVSGGATSAIPSQYKVAADAPSIEPMGVEAAKWMRTWLGPRNRIAADRTNRLLAALYGRQAIATTIHGGVDTSTLFAAPELTDYERGLIHKARLDYVLVDLRLSQALPQVGVYFEKGEPADVHKAPLDASALLKFNKEPSLSRLFDNGSIHIYDVGALRE